MLKSPIKYINPVLAEVPKEEQPEVQKEEKEEEVKESEIQIIQFVDEQGNPMVGAVVAIEGREYVTDGRGEIVVKDFNKNKIYKIDIEYKGMKYTEEILGTRENFNRVVVDISEEGVKGFDWKIPVYIFLGVILVLILFFLLSKDKKEAQQGPLD